LDANIAGHDVRRFGAGGFQANPGNRQKHQSGRGNYSAATPRENPFAGWLDHFH
jgi:hypothetical protein